MADIILGSDLMLFKGNNVIACATSCKLTLNANVLETSSKDSGKWATKQASKLSWTCSSDNLFTIEDYTALMDACIAREEVEIQFSTATNAKANSNGYKGSVIITSVDANASDGDNATYTVSMEGTGELNKVA